MTGLALCCFLARMAIRLTYQKRLRLDDAFLILAATCLCIGTGILYHITYLLYMHAAVLLAPEVLGEVFANFGELRNAQKKVYPLLAMFWTTIFAVKGCFLVYMHPLVWHISRAVKWYYWFVVGSCMISWMVVIVDPFIICPYFGADASESVMPLEPRTPSLNRNLYAVQCFISTLDKDKTLGLTAFITVLDILSDLMSTCLNLFSNDLASKLTCVPWEVVTIPMIVLRNSFLRLSTKIGLAIFLCLSIFMAICALIRIAGFHYKGVEDDTWVFFWHHIEGAVAIMMASITAFRTLFVKQTNDARNKAESPAGSAFRRICRRFQLLARAQPVEKHISFTETGPVLKLPKLPSPTFTGVRTFIRKNQLTEMGEVTCATLNSVVDGSEGDYHVVVWAQTHGTSERASSQAKSSNLS